MRILAGDIGGTKTLLQIADHTAAGWPIVHGVRALIGAGTGLGQAWMARRVL